MANQASKPKRSTTRTKAKRKAPGELYIFQDGKPYEFGGKKPLAQTCDELGELVGRIAQVFSIYLMNEYDGHDADAAELLLKGLAVKARFDWISHRIHRDEKRATSPQR